MTSQSRDPDDDDPFAPSEERAAIDALAARLTAKIERDEREGRGALSRKPSPVKRLARPAPDLTMPFTPDLAHCAAHGAYPINARDEAGVVRYYSPDCPHCRKQHAAERLLSRAAIAPRFAGCDFHNFIAATPEQETALGICRRYAADFAAMRAAGTCLILRGRPGTGKNHLAAAIARSVVAQGYSTVNATAHEIIRRVRDTWTRGSLENETGVVKEFAAIDLLIIDEVGRQYKSRDGADSIELFNVIDARYRKVAPTVIISNHDRESIRQYLGSAAYDRLREGGGVAAHFDWESHRV